MITFTLCSSKTVSYNIFCQDVLAAHHVMSEEVSSLALETALFLQLHRMSSCVGDCAALYCHVLLALESADVVMFLGRLIWFVGSEWLVNL